MDCHQIGGYEHEILLFTETIKYSFKLFMLTLLNIKVAWNKWTQINGGQIIIHQEYFRASLRGQ